ncbi:GTP diphosphokinase [Ectothiorhodospira lacustris]|uniref:GTP diphosphokinase n=1 Tax=Ectothiorhodospira lacustris TaxID=2899127 RepID=UPI001EE8480B|nr:GTP diphosphokinase [Ectothiorhodospira lacustris]MCG5510095.1 GTP diphosphokinase [Ectothiorhodospira lacustris]MCG5521938.1 GTP diphosphokinase [Ectothiorhodospira lacustris]
MRHTRYDKSSLVHESREALAARFTPPGGGTDVRLSMALTYALADHERQTRQPHCLDVAENLRVLGVDKDTLIATLLLDAHFDGSLSDEDLSRHFGEHVTRLVKNVHLLTTFRSAPGQLDGAPEQAERLRRMLLAMVDDVRAVLIKLAYRLQHLRLMSQEPDELARAYARETQEIFTPLANRLGVAQLKWEMEDLAFRIQDPDHYRMVAKLLEESRLEREQYIQDFTERLRQALVEEHVAGEVRGRPKHIYSIWKKMDRKQLEFQDLYDLRAVRVIVDRVSTCYAVLGVVHSCWPHIPKEFDDYIANPKDNGYQSLHTAVIGPNGKVVEVQIRTRDMDAFAELGVAAHWRYKEGGREDQALMRAIASLRRLLDHQEDDRELLEDFRSELFQDRVFVLTPRGDVVDLPKGATPLDFAYAIHTEVGHRCRGAKVNGRIVPLTHELRSGERVEVLTTRQGGPSRDWMNPNMGYLRTSRARSKARSWFKLQDHDKNLHEGRQILEREAQRQGVSEPDMDELLKRFHQPSRDELLVAVGAGEITPAQLASAMQVPMALTAEETLMGRRSRRPAEKGGTGEKGIQIRGVGNLLTQVARCCRPVPGDLIVGYITRGKGVTIHRRDCINILRMPTEKRYRLVEVTWGEERQAYPVVVHVEAFDRQGLLRDITQVLANERINVLAASTRTDPAERSVTMDLTLEITDTGQLSTVMDKIGALPNIFAVRRVATG